MRDDVTVSVPCRVCLAAVVIEVAEAVSNDGRMPWEVRHGSTGGHTLIWTWPDLTPIGAP